MPINKIWMNNFDGDLRPLAGTPITEIHMSSFYGDVSAYF
jgi:hypothetical protein